MSNTPLTEYLNRLKKDEDFAKKANAFTQEFVDFLNKSRSPYAAVESCRKMLIENGFIELKESEEWNLERGKKYFYTRNKSTIVSFAIGKNYQPNNGFNITVAHTDSPSLKLKPVSKVEKFGFKQVGVQLYGGGIWHTWFDRDLGISGLVLVRENNKVVPKIINITKPVLIIPSLAIHLDGSANQSFAFNKESQFVPILSTTQKLENLQITGDETENHHSELLELIASEVKCKPSDICGLDLSLCDAQDSVIGGYNKEFIFSGRLDNLMMSFCCQTSIIEASKGNSLDNESNTYVCVLFDHEEVGSLSLNGANSTMLETALRRIASGISKSQNVDISIPIRKSLLFSCDMAHGVHPNYSEKHESNHRPILHKGPVIKVNANQRYTTNAETSFIAREIAKMVNVPLQEFVLRNDVSGGSTVGPILAGKLGMRCIDIGIAQLAMHSIREMAGVSDLIYSILLLKEFYNNFSKIDNKIDLDK